MATCKDCVHINVCKSAIMGSAIVKRINGCFINLDEAKEQVIKEYYESCNHFKDRSRFVELPCKVGDTVYIIARISGKEEIIQDSVESFTISSFVDNTPIILFDGIETCDWDSSDFGKQVFLTKEEAEQALAKQNQPDNTPQ